jgi:hypothetical protein
VEIIEGPKTLHYKVLDASTGRAARARFQNGPLCIRERLAKSDPGNAGAQREISKLYERVGNVQAAQGDLAGALNSYRDSLAIRERLAKSDPGNAGDPLR